MEGDLQRRPQAGECLEIDNYTGPSQLDPDLLDRTTWSWLRRHSVHDSSTAPFATPQPMLRSHRRFMSRYEVAQWGQLVAHPTSGSKGRCKRGRLRSDGTNIMAASK